MFNKEEFQKIVNVPYAVIIASGIIIVITSFLNDENSLRGLLGGYLGLGLGILFLLMLNMSSNNVLDAFPFIMILCIIGLLMYYIYTYFDKITQGEVSNYYNSFSFLSNVFLATQISILFSSIFNKLDNSKLFSDKTFSILTLIAVINFLLVIIMGIVLKFYSTQG